MSVHEELAAGLFLSGCTCAQAIFTAFCDLTGMERETALRLSSSFGGGMGRLRETCGAVTGMFMVAGLLYGFQGEHTQEEKAAHYARIQALAGEFRAAHKTLLCRELLQGINTDTSPVPEERTAAYYSARPCEQLIRTAARILDDYIQTHPI